MSSPAWLSEGNVYNFHLQKQGDEGDGKAVIPEYNNEYTIYVQGAEKGDTVRAEITFIHPDRDQKWAKATPIEIIDDSQPFFAYGVFKKGELAYAQIRDHVEKTEKAQVSGSLFHEDGLILLYPDEQNEPVSGNLIQFRDQQHARMAYQKITDSEPISHYIWSTLKLDEPSDQIANVLIDKRVNEQSESTAPKYRYPKQQWTGRDDDPLFTDGLDSVKKVYNETRNLEQQPTEAFFRCQMAYLLLWSAVDRYISLKYGKSYRESQYDKRARFSNQEKEAIENALQCEFCNISIEEGDYRRIVASNRLSKSDSIPGSEPEKLINYYYSIRNNVVHRGKGAIEDKRFIEEGLIDLYNIFRCHIIPQHYTDSSDHVDII